MATFVLVHGSHDGGWVWQRVAPRLRTAGHQVYTPTLTGLSDRSHLLACGVDLTTHITDIANLLVYEDLSEVILVGHSYAGMVITGVAARVPERLKLLVYLDAYLPDDGQSEADLWPPDRRALAEAAEDATIGVAQPPSPARFGVSDPTLVDWITARQTPQPVATYKQSVPPGNARGAALPRVFIQCTANPPTTPDVFGPFAAKARAKGWEVRELAAGHLAMLTAPTEVADELLELAVWATGQPRRRGPGGVLRPAGAGEAADLGPNRAVFSLRGEETGGKFSLTEFTMAPPPAPGPPPHIHLDADEVVYILDGTLEMGVGDQALTGTPGALMLAPRGTLHSLANVGTGPARMLVILSPPGYEGFWREMAELRARLGAPPDPDTVQALQWKYHLSTGGETRRFE